MSEAAGNGHARIDDLRSDVSEHYQQISQLQIRGAQVDERLRQVERTLERLVLSIDRLHEDQGPKSQRERATLSIQVITIVAMILSMLLPYLRH